MPTQVEIPGTGAKVPVWVILGGAGAALLLGFLKGSPTQEADQADQQSSSGMILSEIQRLLGQQREEYLTLFDQTLNQSDGPVAPPNTPGDETNPPPRETKPPVPVPEPGTDEIYPPLPVLERRIPKDEVYKPEGDWRTREPGTDTVYVPVNRIWDTTKDKTTTTARSE